MIHDLVEAGDRLRLLDLGHHGGAPARDLLGLGDVLRALDEGQRHPVDAGIERGLEIGNVLGSERGGRNGGVRQVDALAVGQSPADLDARDHALGVRFGDREAHLAVVDQQRMAGRDRRENFRMRQVGALCIARGRIAIEHETVALRHHGLAADEGAEPQLGTLQIDQDADRPAGVLLEAADRRHQFAHAVLAGVTHIDAEDVGAGRKQLRDHAGVGGGRSERGDDLGAAQASHFLLPLPLPGGGAAAGGSAPGGARVAVGLRAGDPSALSVSCTVQARCSPVSTSKKPVRS